METPHVHWRAWTNPDYIGAFCPIDRDTIATIEAITKRMVKGQDGKESECTIAILKNSKPMVLNKVNRKTLTKLYKTSWIDEWVGRSFTVYPTVTKVAGETVDCLRIRETLPIVPGTTPPKPVDYTNQIATLRACKTLDNLKFEYSALDKAAQTALVGVKDEMKTKLSAQ